MEEINSVSIKFKPGAYHVFKNLQNKYWFAIGEYVDNAVQSFEDNRKTILEIEGPAFQFEIKIDFDWEADTLTIADNAGGIDAKNFHRAFEPANIPSDANGLHEFGMGMKTASIWLADTWTVCTAPINEPYERTVEFDLPKVMAENKEELEVITHDKPLAVHYTIITLKKLSKNSPSVYQLPKLKSHLASIYRKFIRNNTLNLFINGEKLYYNDPEILEAPSYLDKDGPGIYWKKEVDYDDGHYKAKGFLALLNELSTSTHNGLALFRRGRVIEGSHDEKYMPKVLFGQVGSFRYKRLFGELELEGFDVSFNKGSFQDQGEIEVLMDALKIEMSSGGMNLLKQADEYRKPKPKEEAKVVAKELISALVKEEKSVALNDKIVESIREIEVLGRDPDQHNAEVKVAPLESMEEPVSIKGKDFLLKLELVNEPMLNYLYTLALGGKRENATEVNYKVNLSNPFFERFEQFKTMEDYRPIVLIVRALVIAELHAPSQGTKNAGNVRLNFNTFLKYI